MKKLAPFAAGGLASLALIAIGISVPLASAQSPVPTAKPSASGTPASSAKKLKSSVDKSHALATDAIVANATALTRAECKNLGGQISYTGFCKSGEACSTKDAAGKAHNVCVTKSMGDVVGELVEGIVK